MIPFRIKIEKIKKETPTYKICSRCFSKNLSNYNLCHKCGHETFEPIKIDYDKEYVENIEKLEFKKCPDCNSETPLYFNFCTTCGHVFQDLVLYKESKNKPPFVFDINYQILLDMRQNVAQNIEKILPLLAAVAVSIPQNQWYKFLLSIKIPKEYIPVAVKIMKTMIKVAI